jgi:hypothetical protein
VKAKKPTKLAAKQEIGTLVEHCIDDYYGNECNQGNDNNSRGRDRSKCDNDNYDEDYDYNKLVLFQLFLYHL